MTDPSGDLLQGPAGRTEESSRVLIGLGRADAGTEAAVEPLREQLWRDLLGAPTLVGVSPAAAALRAALPTVANSREPLFLVGEPGSGRRSLAAAVHRSGPGPEGPFIAENLAVLPETLHQTELFGANGARGLVSAAAGGTLYLAGVEHLPAGAQERLLRHLADAAGTPSSPRIIASADADLGQAVRRGRFRHDLAERLSVLRLTLPPLRQRAEDIPLIAAHLLRRGAAATGAPTPALAPEALVALQRHAWPGNLRELDEVLARAGAGRTLVRAEDLPGPIAGDAGQPQSESGSTLREVVSELEIGLITRTLDETNWNKSRAARTLGLSRLGLQKKIDRYGIDRRR